MFFHLMGANGLPPFVWTGNGGDTNWSTPGNWSSNVVPGISDVAIFMGSEACNVSCAATVDTNISILGIDMRAGYTGTITQAATKTIIIGASGWTQSAGTFVGGDSAITLSGPSNFSGGAFTSTSGTLSVAHDFTLGAALTFNHNNGTFINGNGALRSFDINGQQFYDFTYSGSCSSSINLSGTIKVVNLLSLNTSGCPSFNGGTIEAYGDITTTSEGIEGTVLLVIKGAANQTITGIPSIKLPSVTIASTGGTVTFSGTINLLKNFIYQSGNVATSGAVMVFSGGSNTIDPQTVTFTDVTFAGGSTTNLTLVSAVNVYGTLIMNIINGGNINSSSINAYGDIVDNSSNGWTGTSVLNIVGTGNQNITSTGTNYLNLININSSGGTVTFTGIFNLKNTFSYTVGTVVATAADFCLCSNVATTYNIPFQINNLTLTGGSTANYTLVTDINALGNLTIDNVNNGTLSGANLIVSGNVISDTGAGFSGTANLQLVGGNNTTINIVAGAKLLGGALIENKNSLTNTVTQSTAVSLATAGQSMSVTTGTYDMNNFNLSVNSTLTVGVNGKVLCRSGVLTAATYVIDGQISCGPGAGITWTGLAGDNLWSTAGNWTNNNIPGAGDIAVFNGVCTGANCNVTMNSVVNVKGIKILSSYTGTITQAAGIAVTVGTSGWSQVAGTFIGGNSTITMNGPYVLTGGAFTSTTSNLNITEDYTISGSPTFTHNSGTVRFTETTTIVPGTVDYYNVTFAGTQRSQNLSGGTMNVYGLLTLADASSCCAGAVNSGTIMTYGNVSFSSYGKSGTALIKVAGSTDQTITGVSTADVPNLEIISTAGTVTISGTLIMHGNFTYTSGTVDTTTSTIQFVMSNVIVPGDVDYYNVSFLGTQKSQSLSGGTMKVYGALVVSDSSVCCAGAINTGTVLAYGNVSFSSYGKSGTALIKVAGSTDQTITGVSTADVPNLEIISTAGTVTISGTLNMHGNFTYTSGTVDTTTSTLLFVMSNVIVPGNVAYYNVSFGGSQKTQNLSGGTMNVHGLLTIADTHVNSGTVNSGTIMAYGNVTIASQGKSGTALIKIVGSTDQTISGVTSADIPSLEIASSGGIVSFSGVIYMRGNFTYTSGTVNAGTSTLHFIDSLTIVPGAVDYYNVTFGGSQDAQSLSGGTMKVNGLLTVADTHVNSGTINTGTIEAYGNVAFSSNGKRGSAILNFVGAASTTMSASSTSARAMGTTIVINKTGGATVALTSDVTFNYTSQDLTISGGTLNLAGFNLTIVDRLTVDATTTLNCSGGDFTSASVTNNGTINCPGYGAYEYNWTGAALDGNFDTAGNWQGGVAPTATSVVVFDDAFCGANCNATVNTATSIKGMQMNAGYTGTITQSVGNAITIGTKHWTQAGGTFIGSDAAINVNGNMILSGGAFTSTSGILTTKKNFTVSGSPSFTHNSGEVYFTSSLGASVGITPGTFSFHKVTIEANNTVFTLTGTMTVNNLLTIKDIDSTGSSDLTSGTINVYGDFTSDTYGIMGTTLIRIVGSGDQTVTGVTTASRIPSFQIASTGGTVTFVGTPFFRRNYTYTSGTVNAGTSSIRFHNNNITSTVIPGNVEYNNVRFSGTNGIFNLSGTMTINGTLTIGDTGTGTRQINTGTLLAKGDVIFDNNGYNGTAALNFGGSGDHTLTRGATNLAANSTFASDISGWTQITGASTQSWQNSLSGDGSTGFLRFSIASNTSWDRFAMNTGPLSCSTSYDVSFWYRTSGITGNVNIFATANFATMSPQTSVVIPNSASWAYYSTTLTTTASTCPHFGFYKPGNIGAGFIDIDQVSITVSGAPSVMTGAVTVNKTSGGSVTLASSASFGGATQDLTITEGTLNMAGYALTIGRNISNSGTLQRGVSPACGVLTYSGTYTGNAAVCP